MYPMAAGNPMFYQGGPPGAIGGRGGGYGYPQVRPRGQGLPGRSFRLTPDVCSHLRTQSRQCFLTCASGPFRCRRGQPELLRSWTRASGEIDCLLSAVAFASIRSTHATVQ